MFDIMLVLVSVPPSPLTFKSNINSQSLLPQVQVSNNFLFQHQLLLSIVWFKVHHRPEKETDIIGAWDQFNLQTKTQKMKGDEMGRPGQTIS